MLILSQNKKLLVAIENSSGVYTYENKLKIDLPEGIEELGKYSNEERTIEVLKIIYNRYDRGQRVFEMPEE